MNLRSLLPILVLAAAGCSAPATEATPAPEAPPATQAPVDVATVALEARAGSKLTGGGVFSRLHDGRIRLVVEVENVDPGLHAAHIHEHGDCSDPKAASAGGHWNPTSKPHGKWGQADGAFHLGDLGNFEVGADGKGRIEIVTDLWTVGGGAANDVVGRSIIVHAKPDDFTTQPTGNAGDRIGCGPIVAK